MKCNLKLLTVCLLLSESCCLTVPGSEAVQILQSKPFREEKEDSKNSILSDEARSEVDILDNVISGYSPRTNHQPSGSKILEKMKPRERPEITDDLKRQGDADFTLTDPVDELQKENKIESMRTVQEFRIENDEFADQTIGVESLRTTQRVFDDNEGFRIAGDENRKLSSFPASAAVKAEEIEEDQSAADHRTPSDGHQDRLQPHQHKQDHPQPVLQQVEPPQQQQSRNQPTNTSQEKESNEFIDIDWVLSQYSSDGGKGANKSSASSNGSVTQRNGLIEDSVKKVLSGTMDKLKKRGLRLGGKQNGSCGPNEVYLLDKDKMVLVSSGDIAHELSDLTSFEDNLLQQIENQESIIRNLKSRLTSYEKEKINVHNIVKSFKDNEESNKVEMRITRGLLDMANKRLFSMERSLTKEQDISRRANQEIEEMDMIIKFKDQKIKELVEELEHGHIKQELIRLSGRVEVLKKQAQLERKAKEKLEEDLSKLDVVTDEKANLTHPDKEAEKCLSEMKLERKLVQDQDARIKLLRDQVAQQTKTTEFLNNIIIEKDKTILRLQNQVTEYLNHDISSVMGCMENDTLITAQYEALSNFRGFTNNQAKYRKAKDTALKILQNTVFEMVDQIPTCRDTAVDGLKKELSALQLVSQPFESNLNNLQISLNRAVEFHKKGQKYIIENMNKVISRQKEALDVCHRINQVEMKEANLSGFQSQRVKRAVDFPLERDPSNNKVQFSSQSFPQSYRVKEEPVVGNTAQEVASWYPNKYVPANISSVDFPGESRVVKAANEVSDTDTDVPATSSKGVNEKDTFY